MKKTYEHLAVSAKTSEEAIKRIKEIITILRVECPWDKKQNHKTLRSGMIEEAYEVVEAINNDDVENLKEELGDVLLQVVFHSNLAEENKAFDLTDVINDECEKMIRRHPHVFSEEISNNSNESIDKVLEKWENIKAAEKKSITRTQILESVPKALPALTKATKVQKKAAEVGFDWDDAKDALDKIREETEELAEAAPNDIVEELGDLLFSVVNVARFLKVDPEEALNEATKKFIRRFAYIEGKSFSYGKPLEDMSLKEMDKLWNEAKKSEKEI